MIFDEFHIGPSEYLSSPDAQGLDTGHPIYLAGTIFGLSQSANEILAFFITQ